MEFRLLGGVTLHAHGDDIDVGTRKQRTVLAALLLADGRLVTTDRLAYAVWGDQPPTEYRANLATYVSRLRRLLTRHGAEACIEHRTGGYALTVDPAAIDITCFRASAARARRAASAGDDQRAAEEFTCALSHWRGEPLAGLAGDWAFAQAADLLREQCDVHADHIDTLLRLGRGNETLDLLHRLTSAHPLDERFAAQLMKALHQVGRTAQALSLYEAMRRRLARELGTDPSRRLQQVHVQILRSDPAVAGVEPGPLTPAQLPADVPAFTGRTEHLVTLDQLLEPSSDTTAVVISAIAGTAGVGKTALAVHWAHLVRDHFDDGQLYVNLRGFDPEGTAVPAAEAIRGFLDAFAVPPQRIPAGLDAQAALYRTVMATKRILVVLDNARDADQIRPLLPGSPGCLVVVTSRNQLSSLVAVEGARPITLDLLSPAEALQLLARRIGDGRVDAEPDAAREIVTRCARLPLALAIVAAHASTRPVLALSTLARQLTDARRLDLLTAGDPVSDVRAVLSWSYRTLTAPAARLFRLLGRHPGPDITAPAAASLAGIGPDQMPPLLAELAATSLVTERAPGRYALHDLLRAYAIEIADAQGTDAEREPATHRLLDHYLHTAHRGALAINPHRTPIALGPPRPGVTPETLTAYDIALAWFSAEHAVLLATINHAATDSRWDLHTWQLGWAVADSLDRCGRWHDKIAVQHTALAAADRLGDRAAQRRIHQSLARGYTKMNQFEKAHTHCQATIALAVELDDTEGQAHAHLDLAWLYARQNRNTEGLEHSRLACHLFTAEAHRAGQANALNAIGCFLARLGDHQQAIAHCQQSLELHQQLRDPLSQAGALDSLGYAYHHLGNYDKAVACYQDAIALIRELGERYYEGDTLTRLGDTHQAAGNRDAARVTWQQALAILDELDHPDADDVRNRLAPSRHPSDSGDSSPPA